MGFSKQLEGFTWGQTTNSAHRSMYDLYDGYEGTSEYVNNAQGSYVSYGHGEGYGSSYGQYNAIGYEQNNNPALVGMEYVVMGLAALVFMIVCCCLSFVIGSFVGYAGHKYSQLSSGVREEKVKQGRRIVIEDDDSV